MAGIGTERTEAEWMGRRGGYWPGVARRGRDGKGLADEDRHDEAWRGEGGRGAARTGEADEDGRGAELDVEDW